MKIELFNNKQKFKIMRLIYYKILQHFYYLNWRIELGFFVKIVKLLFYINL